MVLARADSDIGTRYGVHSFLAMQSIGMLGSDDQRSRWPSTMARMNAVGTFGMTEPEHGSDAVQLETAARRDGDASVRGTPPQHDGARRLQRATATLVQTDGRQA